MWETVAEYNIMYHDQGISVMDHTYLKSQENIDWYYAKFRKT